MQTDFTEDQRQFRGVVARFLDDHSPVTAVRTLLETESGFDAVVWQRLCMELGLSGIHLPESDGGSGFGPVELGIVMQEMGRTLYSGPFFSSSVCAAGALLHCADEGWRQSLLPSIASGEKIGTLLIDNLQDLTRAGDSVKVSSDRLSGSLPIVLDGHIADLLVVVANGSLYLVDASANGVETAARDSLDPTRRLASITLKNSPAKRIGTADKTSLNALWDDIAIALSHEMIGGAQRLFESTIEYMNIRYQFGRPIGSFQGLKHRCADLLLELEWAKAVTHHAAYSLASGEAEPHIASMAKAMASDVYMKAAREAIQLRGGIGFTWEEDTHLWYKRAKSSEVLFGAPHLHRERMMNLMEAAA